MITMVSALMTLLAGSGLAHMLFVPHILGIPVGVCWASWWPAC
ncbi:MAG: hypothetical protein R3E89_06590 [Thiolinea sp.]